jgi:hypothetical protein
MTKPKPNPDLWRLIVLATLAEGCAFAIGVLLGLQIGRWVL